jgi:hypothetical protein
MQLVTCLGFSKTRIQGNEILETVFACLKDGRIFESFEQNPSDNFHNRVWFQTVESLESVKAKAEFIGNYDQAPILKAVS